MVSDHYREAAAHLTRAAEAADAGMLLRARVHGVRADLETACARTIATGGRDSEAVAHVLRHIMHP